MRVPYISVGYILQFPGVGRGRISSRAFRTAPRKPCAVCGLVKSEYVRIIMRMVECRVHVVVYVIAQRKKLHVRITRAL